MTFGYLARDYDIQFFFFLTSVLDFLNDADDFNVIIQVGEDKMGSLLGFPSKDPKYKRIHITFSSNWSTKKDDVIRFNKPNITPIVFDMLLK